MRMHNDVVAERLSAADESAQASLRQTAKSVAEQWATNDRVRRVVGVKRTRRDLGAACAGLLAVMVASYATALSDE